MVYNNQLMPTGTINDVGEYLRENVDDSYRLGLELDANYDISEQLNWNVNATLSQNKIKDLTLERDGGMKNFGTTNMAFSPNTIIGNTITYKPVKNLQLSFLSKFVGEQYLSNTDTESSKLDSYFVSDFNIAYSLKLNKVVKSIDFYGLVNNIFNKEYVDRGYTYLDFWSGPTSTEIPGYFPQATINFLLGATIKF